MDVPLRTAATKCNFIINKTYCVESFATHLHAKRMTLKSTYLQGSCLQIFFPSFISSIIFIKAFVRVVLKKLTKTFLLSLLTFVPQPQGTCCIFIYKCLTFNIRHFYLYETRHEWVMILYCQPRQSLHCDRVSSKSSSYSHLVLFLWESYESVI